MIKQYLKTFVIGSIIHLILWLLALDLNPANQCYENSCWAIIMMDIPFSMFYSTTQETVKYGSVLIGTIWWGLLFCFIVALVKKLTHSK